MEKMLAVILLSCFAFSSHCLDQYNKNLKELKKEINEIFEITNLDHLQTELNKVFSKISPALQKEFNEVFKTAITKNKAELDRIFEQANPPIDLQAKLSNAITTKTSGDLQIALEGILNTPSPIPNLKTKLDNILAEKKFEKNPSVPDLKKDFNDIFKKATDASNLEKEFETVFTDDSVIDALQRRLNDILKKATNKDPKLQQQFDDIFKKVTIDPNLRSELQTVFLKATPSSALQKEFDEVFEKPIHLITVTRVNTNNGMKMYTPAIKQKDQAKDLLDKIKIEIPDYDKDSDIKVISFNEMFFSQDTPLEKTGSVTDVTHYAVLELAKDLSTKIKNSIIFVNILYTDTENITKEELLYNYALTRYNELKWRVNTGAQYLLSTHTWGQVTKLLTCPSLATEKAECDTFATNKSSNNKPPQPSEFLSDLSGKILNKTKKVNSDMLINRTYCVFNGEPIFFYDKSTYFQESHASITSGKVYKFGNGYCTPIITSNLYDNHKEKFNAIFNSIGVEICMDYACGIKKSTNWHISDSVMQKFKLLLIQSNCVLILGNNNNGNIPKDIAVLYSDAFHDFRDSMVASGNLLTCFVGAHNKELTYSLEGKPDIIKQKYREILLDSSAIGGIYPSAIIPQKEEFKIFIHEL